MRKDADKYTDDGLCKALDRVKGELFAHRELWRITLPPEEVHVRYGLIAEQTRLEAELARRFAGGGLQLVPSMELTPKNRADLLLSRLRRRTPGAA